MCGLHRTVFNHVPGPCQTLEGVVGGSEDIVTLPNGLAFISSVSVFDVLIVKCLTAKPFNTSIFGLGVLSVHGPSLVCIYSQIRLLNCAAHS